MFYLVVWGMIAAGLVYFAVKRTRIFLTLLGFSLLFIAAPAGLMSTWHDPTYSDGYIVGGALAFSGVIILVIALSLSKKKKPRRS